MTRRIYTDIPDDQLPFMLAMIRHANGRVVEQSEEPDGENYLVVDYPDPTPAPEAAAVAAAQEKRAEDWMKVAVEEIGVREIPGAGSNERIEEYFKKTSLGAQTDDVPWCSAFVNWVMDTAGYPRTNSAMARSWVNYGRDAGALTPGAIVVLKRGAPPKGHVGFCVRVEDDTVFLLGGNQRDEVNVTGFDISRVIAHRLPEKD